MEGAESPDEIGAVNRYHLTIGEHSLKGGLCLLIARGVVRRQKDNLVRNVEIGVTGR
jgi:hypothetical protein